MHKVIWSDCLTFEVPWTAKELDKSAYLKEVTSICWQLLIVAISMTQVEG
jgi:hypothetical protein